MGPPRPASPFILSIKIWTQAILSSTGSVAIAKTETPENSARKTSRRRLSCASGGGLLDPDGNITPQPQGKFDGKPRSKPTRKEEAALHQRLPHWVRRGGVSSIVRNLYILFVYYSGLYFLVHKWHGLSKSRGAIFLHHRVNDYAKDPLTVDSETFAAQLLAISKRYPISTTADIVDHILTGKPLPPTTVAIHFDDCYRDILTNGAPIMKALRVPACAFINSGFIDTNRTFAHDAAKYPFTFEMLSTADVQRWRDLGFEVGAHTVNHVDLGRIAMEEAPREIAQCGQDLEKILGKPVYLFSFPFGRTDNITAPTREIVKTSGYTALFSAHGGFIGPRTDPFDIPRGGANHEASPVYCLLQIEGLTLSQLRG